MMKNPIEKFSFEISTIKLKNLNSKLILTKKISKMKDKNFLRFKINLDFKNNFDSL